MEKNRHCYQIIKDILSQSAARPCSKEEIVAEIVKAIGGYDYLSAVIDYLWGAYYNFDPAAKAAFNELFSDELRERKPDVFYFFSFHFSNNSPRRGFDRRLESDRRECYSLDIHGKTIERRSGRERRREDEKRLDWTRITGWVSVPFKPPEGRREGEVQTPDGYDPEGIAASSDTEYPSSVNLQSLNAILSCLIAYFENHMQPRQTAWMDSVHRETFERAKHVMRILLEMPKNGWPAGETGSGGNPPDPKGRYPRR